MKILAIDFDSVFRRMWEAEDGKEMSAARLRTIDWTQRNRDNFDRVVIACDSGPSFRKAKVEEYKAGRTNPGAAYFEQRRMTLERLRADGCILIDGPAVEGGHAEADDVLGWLAAAYVKHTIGLADDAIVNWTLRIVSGDADLEQLICDADAIDLLKPTEREPWKEAQVLAARGVTPSKVPHLKALCGDKSDNYPGFEGIGGKTAAALIMKFGDAVSAVAGADDATVKLTAPQRASLKAGGAERAAMGVYLATLKIDLPLDFAVLLLPEPTITPIAKDEPLGGEPEPIPQARPTPPAPSEPAPSRAMTFQVPPGFAERVEATPPEALQRGEIATPQQALQLRPATTVAISFGPLDLQPYDLDAAWKITKAMYDAKIYPQYPNREAMFAVILDARERGVGASAALRAAYVVKGRLGWSAAYMAGLVLASGKADFFELVPEECDATKATLRFRRKGRPEGKHVFTIEDARRAGYIVGGSPWEKDPKAMLRAAVTRTGARGYFPDVTSGLFMPDELRGRAEESDLDAANV